jgi:DNA-binding transcriptional ArsR family regulator
MNLHQATARATILKALANPVRLLVVDELSRGDRCVCDLLPLARVDQSVLSRHLAVLKNVGIVTERREGVKVIHHLECPCILQALDCTVGVMKSEATRQGKLLDAERSITK